MRTWILSLLITAPVFAQVGGWHQIEPIHIQVEGHDVTCSVIPAFMAGATLVPAKTRCSLPDGTEFKPHFGPMENQISAPLPSCDGRKKISQRHGHLWWKHTDTWDGFSKRIKSNSCALVDRHWQPIPAEPLNLAGISNAVIVEDHACFTKKSELWGKPCN